LVHLVDYAPLPTLDLALAHTPEGRLALLPKLLEGMHTHGFLYAINHGLSSAQTKRIFDIADLAFEGVSQEEKEAHSGKNMDVFEGYKMKRVWVKLLYTSIHRKYGS
jgi:isopenicillin N synthase-like dioxygenase